MLGGDAGWLPRRHRATRHAQRTRFDRVGPPPHVVNKISSDDVNLAFLILFFRAADAAPRARGGAPSELSESAVRGCCYLPRPRGGSSVPSEPPSPSSR